MYFETRRSITRLSFGSFCLLLIFSASVIAQPPFNGTIFIDPDIITQRDPTAFQSIEYKGRGVRTMFDRREAKFLQRKAFLFLAKYDDGLQIEIQVNPEFKTKLAAFRVASFYAPVFGQLPNGLRKDVRTSWIHKGDQLFGGGNNNLLIHTGRFAREYVRDGILEEVLVHEAAHTSLDAAHARSEGWLAAQKLDASFISNYARDNRFREDIAESFLPYLAVRYRCDRISEDLAKKILKAIPSRIKYFNRQKLNLYPFAVPDDSRSKRCAVNSK